ncbi:histidine phosphatase family protein [Bacillaceae bacterium SIJ1]|uniref:histidine phosphatase family protein n=1 Tax=Litoribacterium kuwaitense TaxID=1398745 RepID=UPI0013EE153F|nr:histidine phosphatase family protein [Litoribacterium kuwaitense]NGP43824.1 histidine phosphatase family protein [Litoribacterium kuwaitense]
MTRITFVRHGNTDWNVKKRAQGHSSNPLNRTGFQQADAVAKRLANEHWDVLVSSDLLRAKQTAEIIASYINLPILYDQRLRERDRGDIEGTIEEERIERWGKDWRRLGLWQESYAALQVRGREFVEDIESRFQGKSILVVTHGRLLIQTLYELCPNDTEENDLLDNTSVTVIQKNASAWTYNLYNCTSHLEEEAITK